jgi:anti-anti-sigma regulatory factor
MPLNPFQLKSKPSQQDRLREDHANMNAALDNVTHLRPSTRTANMVDADRRSASRDFEVSAGNEQLPEPLQTAALLFANKELGMASDILQQAIESDEHQQSAPCWLGLMDLYCKQSDRPAFDELALNFVMRFERSAPAWDEFAIVKAAPKVEAQVATLRFPTECAGSRLQIIDDLRALLKIKPNPDAPVSVGIEALERVDPEAGQLILDTLKQLRKKGYVLSWQGLNRALIVLCRPLQAGVAKHKHQWLLALELLQWHNDEREFDNRAVDYAVSFEISPPSWEPLSKAQAGNSAPASALTELTLAPVEASTDALTWHGELTGPANQQVHILHQHKSKAKSMSIDLREVTAIDFVCAGDIANALLRTMASGVLVSITGASPMVQALLQLTGVPVALFVKSKK